LGKQLKRAQRSGAAWVAMIGEEEASSGQLRLKRLRALGEGRPEDGHAYCALPLGDPAAVLTSLRLLKSE
jgi:histidyl-tRNA synthetase